MAFGVFFSAFTVPSTVAEAAVDVPPSGEILYLADSVTDGADTKIFQVELDEVNKRSNLYEINGSPIPYTKVDALAASNDGKILYAIDRNTSWLGALNVDTGLFSDIGLVKNGGVNITGIVLAATNPVGDLYAASQDTNEVYIVDKATGVATSKGKVFNGTVDVNIGGADIVFATNGSMYLWTNNNKDGAPRGLYIVNNPLSLPLQATYLGQGNSNFFTGLAIRDNGLGDLVGSDTNIDSIVQLSKIDGSMPVTYPMYLNGVRYAYSFGDMTAGPIVNPLEISKTVEVDHDRTWVWDIEKTSDTNSLTLMTGETSMVDYNVFVTATSTDSDWTVSGEITIYNPDNQAAVISSVTDVIGTTSTTSATTTCLVQFPYTLESEETLVCEYEAVIPAGDTVNTLTVMTETGGIVLANIIQEDVIGGLQNEIDESVILTDSKDVTINEMFTATPALYEFNHPYSLWVGPYNSGDYTFENIATVTTNDNSTTSSDNHIIDVNVFTVTPLHIDKTVEADYNRTWAWDVIKTSDTNNLTLMAGATSTVDYDVIVTATSTDSDWTVSGVISIHNPNIIDASITGVSDMIGTTMASTTCAVEFPYILAPDDYLHCDYEVVIPAGNKMNTATVTTNLDSFVPGNSVNKNVIAGLPTNEIDKIATLSDDKYGAINGALVATSAPYDFDYSLVVGPYSSGPHEFENIATVIAGNTLATSSDNHIITIMVKEAVCTLTQGYWKTHSIFGPAPHDAVWDGLEDTNFYSSGQTYYRVLWTAPKGGNAYYQLAHQYIAAELNVLNGSSVPTEVSEALDSAELLFNSYTPAQVGALRGNNSVRKQFLNLASTLASYNEGMIGPGHCSD